MIACGLANLRLLAPTIHTRRAIAIPGICCVVGVGRQVGIYDALIMLGVLKIIFSRNSVAGNNRITRQRLIAVLHLASAALDSDLRTVALVIRGKPVLMPTAS